MQQSNNNVVQLVSRASRGLEHFHNMTTTFRDKVRKVLGLREAAKALTHLQVILITGSSSGIGLATTLALLAAGAKVFGIDISDAPPALASSPSYRHHKADLLDRSVPNLAVTACLAHFGPRIDALLNVAGISDGFGGVHTLRDEDWDRVMAINATAPTLLMRAVVPIMQAQGGGSIVNVTSTASYNGGVAGVAYTASKHCLLGVTKQTAWRYKKDNIRVNAVAPGPTATNIGTSIAQGSIDLDGMQASKPVLTSHGVNMESGDGIMEASKVC